MDKFKFLPKSKLNNLPKTSGVYSFYDKKELVYIGKAINIQNRVKNHFHRVKYREAVISPSAKLFNPMKQPSYRDDLFIEKVNKISFFVTNSEIEALILEANLIKKYQPKFNVVWRDDKNYFYVAITKGEKPIVYITHQKNEPAEYIGPFVEGNALKKTLRFLRRVFPYYTTKNHPKIKCTYCHLGLCPGPNPNLTEYKKNIKKLISILQGKRNAVLNSLKKEMKKLSRENRFEEAGKIRDRIFNLQQVMSHTNVISSEKVSARSDLAQILGKILHMENKIERIECYDVSNIQGKSATGSMIVFADGKPDKSQYKKFKIKMENEPNDIAMLKEVLERRFAHPEWKYPEVILIDGGIGQLNVGLKIKNQNPKIKNILFISLAKRNKELFIEGKQKPILLKSLPQEIYNLILQLDDEAHKFAIAYHKKLRSRDLLLH